MSKQRKISLYGLKYRLFEKKYKWPFLSGQIYVGVKSTNTSTSLAFFFKCRHTHVSQPKAAKIITTSF